jgi:hypothetical protein
MHLVHTEAKFTPLQQLINRGKTLPLQEKIHPDAAKFLNLQFYKQGTPPWLQERKSLLTCSDMDRILGNR